MRLGSTGLNGGDFRVSIMAPRRVSFKRRRCPAVTAAWLLTYVVAAWGGSARGATVPSLDAKHLWALGMIETGNDDREIGGKGEISRYQLLPAVWRGYTQSRQYRNPAVSERIAQIHWARLMDAFQQTARREPSDFDMYVMWNAGYSYYERRGFNPHRISRLVSDRAQRFVNLANRQ